jgi:hypothetical protein
MIINPELNCPSPQEKEIPQVEIPLFSLDGSPSNIAPSPSITTQKVTTEEETDPPKNKRKRKTPKKIIQQENGPISPLDTPSSTQQLVETSAKRKRTQKKSKDEFFNHVCHLAPILENQMLRNERETKKMQHEIFVELNAIYENNDKKPSQQVIFSYLTPLMIFLQTPEIRYTSLWCKESFNIRLCVNNTASDKIESIKDTNIKRSNQACLLENQKEIDDYLVENPILPENQLNFICTYYGKKWWKIPDREKNNAQLALEQSNPTDVKRRMASARLTSFSIIEFPDKKQAGKLMKCISPHFSYFPCYVIDEMTF